MGDQLGMFSDHYDATSGCQSVRSVVDRAARLRRAEDRVAVDVLAELGASPLLRRFLAFHRENGHVFDTLERLCSDAQRKGAKRLGIKALFERVRWETALETTDPRGLKVNNSFTAYYARLLAEFRPDLGPLFAMRELGPGQARHDVSANRVQT
jgi:hypothetical protein